MLIAIVTDTQQAAPETPVVLPEAVLTQYERFALYNSPYVAHQDGRAIDLYPADADVAPSPVAGEVIGIKTVTAPQRPYAAAKDHLLVIDTDRETEVSVGNGTIARILHVNPTVSVGDTVTVGQSLGTLVRAGFFAPWVDNHIHLGFRPREANYERASGSVPITVNVPIAPQRWDGHGTVVETGATYAVLDQPAHPNPGKAFVGVADDSGAVAIDGGLPHFERGGIHGTRRGPITLLGTEIGNVETRTLTWDDIRVTANDQEITGLSLFIGQYDRFGVRLICPETTFAVGTDITVRIEPGG